jgi:xanthine dehydrogenase accessory factor
MVCSYAITQEEARPVPTPAEGNATLLYQRLTPQDAVWADFLARRLAEGGAWWLVRRLQNGQVTGVGYADGQQVFGLPDAPPAAALCLRKPIWATDGTAAPGMPETEAPQWFAEPLALPGRVYLFGGGHVAQHVAPLLHQLDFPLTLYEERPVYCTEALFPTAEERICAPYAEASARLPITKDDALLVMTSGHGNDARLLQMALQTPAYYLGMIGSSRKIAQTKTQLLELGFTEADFGRVHTPVGLPILAETPMEIAVSVAAEMILCRARQEGRERAERPQPLR